MSIMVQTQYVSFTMDEKLFCLPLFQVENVLHVIEITPLPKAPEIVAGIINVGGEIIPVLNIRKRFRLPEKDIDLTDQIIMARLKHRRVALVVESVEGVIESSGDGNVPAGKILPGLDYVAGVVKLNGGMILIHDLDTFLSLEEERNLDSSLFENRRAGNG